FRQGDVPKGSYLDSDLVDWQATPVTTWPDGSLKHAIIAGRVTCQPNELQQIGLTASPTNRGGANLSESDLVSTLSAVTLECGTETIALNALIGTAAKHRTVASGPIMSNWL